MPELDVDEDDAALAAAPAADLWKREDDFQFSQRVKSTGDDKRFDPKLNLEGYASKGIFDFAKHFLPMTYLGLLAIPVAASTL